MPKAAFFTLGCRLNQTESAIMAKGLENIGYQITSDQDHADLCIINTCTVTNQSNAKCRKKIRSLQKKNPTAIIAVVGCFSQIASQEIEALGNVHLILGNEEKLNLHRYIENLDTANLPIVQVGKLSKTPFTIETIGQHLDSTRANFKIQDGCDFICSFCVIPSARGRSRARTPDNIREELKQLEADGVKEIILTGVNVGTYQYEKTNFLDLLEVFAEFDGIKRVRISSIEPTTIGTEIFEWMKNGSQVLPYLHLPLQSANDEILNKMRRRYSITEYLDFVEEAIKSVPGICIGSDIIVGFPGESEEMFQETFQVLEKAPIHYFHVFPYAERLGTTSAKLQPKVPSQDLHRRALILRKLSDQKRESFVKQFHHKTVQVLFEKNVSGNQWQGYSENYIRVAVESPENLKNVIASVKITHSTGQLAFGNIVA